MVLRRRLAATLRTLRHQAGQTVDDAARHLYCSAARISRMETGIVTVPPRDARDLATAYGADTDTLNTLMGLAREARGRGWWHQHTGFLSDDFATYLGLEGAATDILTYETHLIPGLLQTEPYARAIMNSTGDETPAAVDKGWVIRSTRQRILDQPEPPQVRVVLCESVLRRPVGDDQVMTGQLRRLLDLAARPNISIGVLPFTVPAWSYGSVPFTLLGFPDPADPQIAYAELLTSEFVIDRPEDVGRYVAEYVRLAGHAVPLADAI